MGLALGRTFLWSQACETGLTYSLHHYRPEDYRDPRRQPTLEYPRACSMSWSKIGECPLQSGLTVEPYGIESVLTRRSRHCLEAIPKIPGTMRRHDRRWKRWSRSDCAMSSKTRTGTGIHDSISAARDSPRFDFQACQAQMSSWRPTRQRYQQSLTSLRALGGRPGDRSATFA